MMRLLRLFFIISLSLTASPLMAYVGPGAGFAFIGSFFFIFIAFFLAFFNLLTFPIRILIRTIKRINTLKNAKFKRVVIVGFDGMDHQLFNTLRQQGAKFPNFEKLEAAGTFAPLLSTEPPISPVAWSTFSTGVNPGKHNIFDFLTTDRNTYMPKISLSELLPPKRSLKLGRFIIPLSKPRIELKRKSQSFWKIVGSKGIFSSVLRVPYTFPPEKFYGSMLAGLGTPDLRGTQGSYTFFTETGHQQSDIWEGVNQKLSKAEENTYTGTIDGPGNPFLTDNPALTLSFKLNVDREAKGATLHIGKEKISLQLNQTTQWMKLDFKAGLITVSGIAQWVLVDTNPVKLYLSPINISPENPSMPVAHPKIFSVYLAKQLGPYATLGMAEDTTAVNEKVLPEEVFLQQVYQMQRERELVFFDSLKKIKKGLIVQVFEATDRVQHMFWRYLPGANSPAEQSSNAQEIKHAIKNIYQEMDNFLGKLLPKLSEDDLLLVVSDHGFNAFNRGLHLNSWLHKEGYLVLKDGKKKSDKWFADVDWSKSKAYGQGLNGIFLNLEGREKYGIVKPGPEEDKIKTEIQQKLIKLKDHEKDETALQQVFKREEIYRGPYTQNAPDLIVGYKKGYRVSWESSVNYVDTTLFSDNTRMWSGDHALTRDQIPGILFSNKKITGEKPALIDISPTVLSAFGIKPLPFIEGRDLGVHS